MTLDPSDSAVATESPDTPDTDDSAAASDLAGDADPIEVHAVRLLDAFLEDEPIDEGLADAVGRLRDAGHLWDAIELVVVAEKDPEAARRLLDAAVADA